MNPVAAALAALAGAAIGTPWVVFQELKIRSFGTPLDNSLLDWAKEMGISSPEKIRVLRPDIVPLPAPMPLRRLINRLGFPAASVGGLCLRRGIYLASSIPHPDPVLRHELIHTRQYQDLGGVFPFLFIYLSQSFTHGYHNAPLEREARAESATDASGEK